MSDDTANKPSGLATQCIEAMDRFRTLRAGGMAFEAACDLLEQGLRAAIPTRSGPGWLEPCARCDGTGWQAFDRWVSLYGERVRYVTWCDCSKGQAIKEQYLIDEQVRDSKRGRHDLSQIGKVGRR